MEYLYRQLHLMISQQNANNKVIRPVPPSSVLAPKVRKNVYFLVMRVIASTLLTSNHGIRKIILRIIKT
jgi:hypothetical protein